MATAISSTYKCVDGNNNNVCQVYKIVLKNTSTSTVDVTGYIAFTGIGNMPNLKWRLIDNETTYGSYNSYIANTNSSVFADNVGISANETKTYYMVIWINETGTSQTDKGTFGATITFESANGTGVTSTIGEVKNLPLNKVKVGSYVSYTGNNGCSGNSCKGQNANYVSDSNMGYCRGSKFTVNGWRVAYVKDSTAYLVSAGAPECVCTNSSGTASTSCSDSETTAGLPKHLANLDNKALTYCNSTYAYGGVCNSSSTWAIDENDFKQMVEKSLNNCEWKAEDSGCGYNNDLIDNGSYYVFATVPYASSNYLISWIGEQSRIAFNVETKYASGLRPVIRLKSTVIATGGTGTYTDPYTIAIS